ncbi:maltase [Leucosporidium creatinivorum]|uniref:Maltase n=1 Tax=Leucosporidium creatinivorum TaxID=106004 RepID=A0A1Y2FY67_9BASI|nr:maltase [Leucosporidium creatinivorum]
MPSAVVSPQPKWWKSAVVYQIYPASFCDSNGDGVGDINGITSKLDYLKGTGVTCIWVSPFFQSPQKDMGYDISDYKNVHEPYGTVADVERLIEGCHERGLKVIFDLVINHTSDQHHWFKESRSSKDSPKRDWYHWAPARYDADGNRQPPCNWRGAFGGSVWEWDETTEECELPPPLHPEQPDVNWENADLRRALYDEAILFWLERGCDGFRVDTVNMYSKHEFKDVPIIDPATPWQPAAEKFCNGPRMHDYLREMNKETFSKFDCVTIGELPCTPFDQILDYVSAANAELSCVIQFDLADLDHGRGRFTLLKQDWELSQWKEITRISQSIADPNLGDGWTTTYLENHDQARSVTRYASDAPEHRVNASKMLATYVLSLTGTPLVYQGQEIGMKNCPQDWSIDKEFIDVGTVNCWTEIKQAAKEENKPELLKLGEEGIRLTARDHARTPMQWDSSPQAGFSSNPKTWMRVMDSYIEINAASQVKGEGQRSSTHAFYRHMIALRKAHEDVFVFGSFELLDVTNPHTMTYIKRSTSGKIALIVLNFTAEDQPFELPTELKERKLDQVVDFGAGSGPLAAFEARVFITSD